ncbi:hypothetical protein DL93DRAFT_1974032 [Clavulina sp. PMI_390]|nr:hypothetical protein DL93DRAFT_1974032 [Clavulina sp. PMI_390]
MPQVYNNRRPILFTPDVPTSSVHLDIDEVGPSRPGSSSRVGWFKATMMADNVTGYLAEPGSLTTTRTRSRFALKGESVHVSPDSLEGFFVKYKSELATPACLKPSMRIPNGWLTNFVGFAVAQVGNFNAIGSSVPTIVISCVSCQWFLTILTLTWCYTARCP